jgi:hypothetical protein
MGRGTISAGFNDRKIPQISVGVVGEDQCVRLAKVLGDDPVAAAADLLDLFA